MALQIIDRKMLICESHAPYSILNILKSLPCSFSCREFPGRKINRHSSSLSPGILKVDQVHRVMESLQLETTSKSI